MAISTVDITLNVHDHLAVDFDVRRTRITVSTNIPGESIFDTATGELWQGGGALSPAADGTATLTVPKPGDSNPASWQTYVHIDYPDSGNRGAREVRDFGPFTLTADATLGSLVAEQEIPPTYASTVIAQINALLAQAVAITDTTAFVTRGTVDPATYLPDGTEYVWNKTDGAGTLLDIVSGVA